jgi:hypothetical protein
MNKFQTPTQQREKLFAECHLIRSTKVYSLLSVSTLYTRKGSVFVAGRRDSDFSLSSTG